MQQNAALKKTILAEPTGRISPAPWFRRNRLFVYCLLLSAVVLAICSKSSFLYPFNDWVDANCYFTVGKGMMKGMVLYRDLFEQKGPYLFLLHGIAYLISNTSFIGVYLFEVVAGAFYLHYAAKIIRLYLPENLCYVLLPLLAVLTYAQGSFAEGDSAEEFCLPMLMAGLYTLLQFFSGDGLSPKTLAVSGFLAGLVLWIKFTMLGFWAAWMLGIFVGMLIRKKRGLAFSYALYFLWGILLSTLPWFVYFLVNGALYDWFYTYFYVNIFVYGKVTTGFSATVHTALANLGDALTKNPIMLAGGIFGGCGFLLGNRQLKGVWSKVTLVLCVLFLILGVYGGGKKYVYYFFIFYAFLVLALITLAKWASVLFKSASTPEAAKRVLFVAAVVSVLASSTASYYLSPNNAFMAVQQTDLAQFQFAKIINAASDKTLLNYGFLDGGFYTAAGVLPITKYFCKNNVPDPQMMITQNAIVKNKGVAFVVLRMNGYETQPGVAYLAINYKQVSHVTQIFEGRRFTYLLYQAK